MSKITASSKNSNTLPANKSKREERFLCFVLTAALLGGGREESWKDVRTCPQLSSLLYHSILSFPLPSLLLLPSSFSFLPFLSLFSLPFSLSPPFLFLFPFPFCFSCNHFLPLFTDVHSALQVETGVSEAAPEMGHHDDHRPSLSPS